MVWRFETVTASTAERPVGTRLQATSEAASGRTFLVRSAIGIVGGWTVACGGTLPHPPYIAQPDDALVAVASVPPPARVEYVPARPARSGAVWVDGEWTLRRGRWAWRLGRWLVVPAAARYSPWVFVRAADGALYFAPGTFRDVQGKSVDDPVALAVAEADAVPVVESDGLTAITGRTLRNAETPSAPPK
jgi:hypothetical protein